MCARTKKNITVILTTMKTSPLTKHLYLQPLALVTWGCRLTMSTVQLGIAKNFIKQHALRGPEKVSREGQYDLDLEVPADILTDVEDSVLCPRH
jgi:hypothetical protein